MYKIITEANCIRINDALIPKSTRTITRLNNGVRIDGMDLKYTETTIDGVQVQNVDELFDFFRANGFKDGGGSTGEGVESVTGNLVDNTDIHNPSVNLPDWVGLGREDRIGYLNISEGANIQIANNSVDASKVMTNVSGGVIENLNMIFLESNTVIKKFTLIFLCDVNNITHKLTNPVKINNIPNKAKKGDVWTLMYDRGDKTWDYISGNSIPEWRIDEKLVELLPPSPMSGVVTTFSADGNGNHKWETETTYSNRLAKTKKFKAIHVTKVDLYSAMTEGTARFVISYDMSGVATNNYPNTHYFYNVMKSTGAGVESVLHPHLHSVSPSQRTMIFDMYKFSPTGQFTPATKSDALNSTLMIQIVETGDLLT